jgi:hypothetical protein
VAKSSARTGAWVGGIFGLLAGAAFLWVPGFGPLVVAGSLTAALLGGVEGAETGAAATGVLGWLFSLGISRAQVLKYEESGKAGKYLVITHGSADDGTKAQQILAGTKPAELNVHEQAARPQGGRPHNLLGGPVVMSEPVYQGKPVGEWLKLLGSEEEAARQEAVEALRRMGPAVVPDLVRALRDEAWQVRNQAAVALGAIGPEAKDAVPALGEVLQEEDKYLRSQGAAALGKIGREAGAAVPILTRALRDKDEDVRREAAAALGGIGPEAKAAVPDLVELLSDGRKSVRRQAGRALREIDPEAAARHLGFWARLRRWLGERSFP